MSQTPTVLPGGAAHTLLVHLLTSPNLAVQLKLLHDLALYESGGALLGPEEKEALRECSELSLRLAAVSEEERNWWRSLL